METYAEPEVATVPTRGLGEVPVKGKAQPVPVFTIEGLPARA